MKKIYFYSPRAQGLKAMDQHLYINTTPLYLHSHLRRHRPELAEQVQWAKMQFFNLSSDRLIEEIEAHQCDILCISLYIWNLHVLETIRDIKTKLSRPITIIAGGPSVEIYRDRDYLHKHPDIDFAIFAQGEQAWINIMDHLLTGRNLDVLSTHNLAWLQNGKLKMSQFQYVKMADGSPFLECQDLLQQIVNDPEYHGYTIILPYETSKGCAYNCSFCDWTSGLSHQTSHRRFDIETELDMLGRLGITHLHPSDANFGEHRQDIEIARTMARLKRERGYNFFIRDTNLSKMKKKEAFQILEILIEAGILSKPKFAVQDIHPEILANVDRPDVPWQVHERYIRELQAKYPGITCEIELIQGLPGQTRETWRQTLIAMQGLKSVPYGWVVLPNSPAGYDPEFRERWKIKTMQTRSWGDQPQMNEVVVGSFSYDFADYAYFTLLSTLLKFPFLDKLQDRAGLFRMVDQSSDLNPTLAAIGQAILEAAPGKTVSAVLQFIKNLMKENSRSWDRTTVMRYIEFVKRDPSQSLDWWDGGDLKRSKVSL